MHCPGANILFVISMLGISLAFSQTAYSMRKSINAVIPLVISIIMLFALFKIMHWPYLGFLSVFTIIFSIATPVLLIIRRNQLKQTAPNLSSQFMMIAILCLISSVFEYSVILFPDALSIAHSLPDIAQVIISMGILLVIRKALQKDGLKDNYQNDYQLINCIGAIFIIGLIFQMLSTN